MSYTALYRKFRPGTFQGLIGQEHIVRTLQNQIKSNRISHAYLFTGTRGTGKTSAAKIFARAVNCENPENGEPCGECAFCKLSADQAAMVIYEIDAASNNGVDHIRDLIDTVKYPPAIGKCKVYIIDEVHMLSAGAFNALLKTLEEPPPHVVFILATTEPHKIPATIHSRCQRFDFRRISAKEIAETLAGYMAQENVAIDADALSYIARVSDGAMRDALSILDQCLSFYFGEHITLSKVLAVVGAVGSDVLIQITDAVYARDAAACMRLIEDIVLQGKDLKHFVAELLEHIRNILVVASVGENSRALDFSIENADLLRAQSKAIDKNMLLSYITVFSELQAKIKYASNERVLFEVACLKLCNPLVAETTGNVDGRLRQIENKIMAIEKAPRTAVSLTEKPPVPAAEEKTVPKLKKAVPDEIQTVIKSWPEFLQYVTGKKEANLSGFLAETTPCYLNNNCLTLACANKFTVDHLKKNEEKIGDFLAKKFKKSFDLRIVESEIHQREHKALFGAEDELFAKLTENLNW